MQRKNRSALRLTILTASSFTMLCIALDTLFHLGIRWKQVPAWIIAGILFGISMYFYIRKM